MYITLEGIIGCGKSTLLSLLEKNPMFATEYEPVELWRNYQIGDNYVNYLEKFYQNVVTEAIPFQLVVANTLLDSQRKLLNKSATYYVQDRSPYSGVRIFAPQTSEYLVHLEGLINKSKVKDPELIVFLDCPIDIAQERLKLRGRGEEKNVTSEYQNELRKNIVNWLDKEEDKGTKILKINNTFSPDETYKYLLNYLSSQ